MFLNETAAHCWSALNISRATPVGNTTRLSALGLLSGLGRRSHVRPAELQEAEEQIDVHDLSNQQPSAPEAQSQS